uniref:Uncharacterized protein n=1 Tax=Lepisosteus oculatus TaxID=7918 RepID=W5LW11_LEPOC
MEEKILEEASHLISHLEKCSGQSMDPKTLFHNAVSNIICAILFGARYNYEDETFQSLIRMVCEITKILNGPWGMVCLLLNIPNISCPHCVKCGILMNGNKGANKEGIESSDAFPSLPCSESQVEGQDCHIVSEQQSGSIT